MKDAYHSYRETRSKLRWLKHVWRKYIPPKVSIFIWNVFHNPTEDNVNQRGGEVYGCYYTYGNKLILEDEEHILLRCNYAETI